MYFTFGILVLATTIVIGSLTSVIPVGEPAPAARDAYGLDGHHDLLTGSGLAVAGSEKRGFVLIGEPHGVTKGPDVEHPGDTYPDITHILDKYPRSANVNPHGDGCPKEFILVNGECIPKVTHGTYPRAPKTDDVGP